jgi:hypothetical protein
MVDLALDELIEKLRAERPAKLGRVSRSKMVFSKAPLTTEEAEAATWVESNHGTQVTEYQYRALALIKDSFHAYRWKKYPEDVCVWAIDEFKPMFNEIHRAIAHLVDNEKLSIHDALIKYLVTWPEKAERI